MYFDIQNTLITHNENPWSHINRKQLQNIMSFPINIKMIIKTMWKERTQSKALFYSRTVLHASPPTPIYFPLDKIETRNEYKNSK